MVRIQPSPPPLSQPTRSGGFVSQASQSRLRHLHTVLAAFPDTRPMPAQGIPPLGMFASRRSPSRHRHASGCSSMVEQKPSKLMTRVRFPSPAPVPADLSPLQQTPERVLRIPLAGAGQSFLSDAGAVLGLGRHVSRIARRGARCRHFQPVCRRCPDLGHDWHY